MQYDKTQASLEIVEKDVRGHQTTHFQGFR